MMSATESSSAQSWGSAYRLTAAEKFRRQSAAMGGDATVALVEYADPKPGMRVLDLACGTGEPGISVADRVGPAGRVDALDQSSDLLEIAHRRAQQRGFDHFVTHCADAHQLPFPDSTFDLSTCRCGIMFFRDKKAALEGLRRVLKPGARACFLAWGPFEQPYWQAMMGVALRHAGGPLIASGAEDPFCFGKPDSLSAVLRSTGFVDVHEETRTVRWAWPGPPDEIWEYARSVSAPLKPMLERISKEQWPAVHAAVRKELAQYYDGSSVNFGAQFVFASGKK
jgi:ubiquinone/menaquinone biosynthesis C-methylase UbiE